MVDFQNAYGEGPRCTPLIDGDRVYVQSCSGEFRCLALADGKLLWQTSFGDDYGVPFLGNKSNDPAAEGNRLAPSRQQRLRGDRWRPHLRARSAARKAQRSSAFDKKTGKELWHAGEDNTAYSSVMVATLAGARQAVHFTADALMGVDAAQRQNPLAHPAQDRRETARLHAGHLRRHRDRRLHEHRHAEVPHRERRRRTSRPSRSGPRCRSRPSSASPVLLGEHLYTLGAGSRTDLVCLDFETGNQLWSQPGFGDYATLTAVNDKLLALNSTGRLFLLKANPAKYEELGRAQICGKTWASPAYADGRIYVKDDAHLTALALAK